MGDLIPQAGIADIVRERYRLGAWKSLQEGVMSDSPETYSLVLGNVLNFLASPASLCRVAHGLFSRRHELNARMRIPKTTLTRNIV